ncbi:uncharacterized protein CLAFUR5_06491 [Fulvia fulva]|uniref:BZIP transcription factor n=1 Tax=Passalora fulva TaxID=5499 RepID=A0A9Q8P9F4_PASFU|nr:uncharacterized protein CLAFUR5_06491 [Fulvia fulva]UJO18103.1 hypothetical protein CLAFUR5_06491 [Fulvia fulva]WPV30325.1 hypothetical protein CLAFUW7_06345 [Fulvia fulva]
MTLAASDVDMSVGPSKPAMQAPPATATTTSHTASSAPPYPPAGYSPLNLSSPDEPRTAAAAIATANAALSQHHTPTPNNASLGKKRKASGQPGSRGVANLTPDQLAKKRANDREAQRAIRERTRNTIEALERRIRELESQHPYQELQRVAQERDRALADCEELRKRLGSIAGIVGGSQRPDLNELAALTAQQPPLPTNQQNSQNQQAYSTSPQGPTFEQQQHIHPELRSPESSHIQTSPPSRTASTGPAFQAGESTLRRWSPSLNHPPGPHFATTNGVQHDQRPPSSSHVQQHTPNGDRHGLSFLLEPSNSTSSATQSCHSPATPEQPIYARLTNVGRASCPLDYLLIDFHRSRTRMLSEGMSKFDAIGPDYPTFAALIDPNSPEREHQHPVSALLVDMLSKFPDVAELPEKVAVLYVMFLVLRWLICPCADCYERLPTMCRPIQEQYDRTHACWLDYLPWPHMRKTLCTGEREVHFDDWFVPYTKTISLNWHMGDEYVLVPAGDNERPSLKLSPAFETHLRNLSNWNLGSEFQRQYPEFVDETVRIKDNGDS